MFCFEEGNGGRDLQQTSFMPSSWEYSIGAFPRGLTKLLVK